MKLAGVLGGTALSRLSGFEPGEELSIGTPYGKPSGPVLRGRLAGAELLFLSRHGTDHTIPPHRVNYRANLWALREAGARAIVAVHAVGGIDRRMSPGRIVIPDQVIDYTWGRAHSFFDGDETAQGVIHIDFTEPFSGDIRAALLAAAGQARVEVVEGGTYGAAQGPRLESAAEIRRMARDGCDLVGMTAMPEAALARELGLEYASCAVVINWAAGVGSGDILVEIEEYLAVGMERVNRVLAELFESAEDPHT